MSASFVHRTSHAPRQCVPSGRSRLAVERVEPGKFTRFVDATTIDVLAGETVTVEIE